MNQEAFAKYLNDRYEDQIDWYDKKAARNQTIYRWLQWSVIALAAITPVLIELKLDVLWGLGFGHVPTATAAVVAILTAGLTAFKYQENWISYRTAKSGRTACWRRGYPAKSSSARRLKTLPCALPMSRPRFFKRPRIWFPRSRLIFTNKARLFSTARTW